MAEVRSRGLRIDVCRRCQGVWFDADEHDALARGQPDEPPPRPEPTAARAVAIETVRSRQRRYREGSGDDGPPDEAWKSVLGILGLPVEMGEMAPTRRPWATWALLTGMVGAAMLAFAGGTREAIATFGFTPAEGWRWGGLTVFTAFFVHAGLGHLLGNAYMLWLVGDNVEDHYGPGRYLLLVAAATLGGAVLHALADPRGDIPCVGASGGISGAMVAYALLHPRARIGFAWFWGRVWWRFPAWLCFAAWALYQVVIASRQAAGAGRVSGLAHLGGAAVGGLLWLWWRLGERSGQGMADASSSG
jgi:membrane associated rhomboid family serine protease